LTKDVVAWCPVDCGHDVVKGDLGVLRATAGDFAAATEACVGHDLASPVSASAAPPAETGFWFLMRTSTSSGNGTYDSGGSGQVGSRDEEIAASGSDCE
jgi:hypothetical protein